MSITSFGLSITEKQLAAAWLEQGRGGVMIAHRAIEPLATGIVAAGWVKRPQQLKTAVRNLLQTAGVDIDAPLMCAVSLPSALTFVSMFSFPAGLRQSEIEQTVPYVAEEALPFSTSEIYYDIRVLGKVGASQEVAYVAAPAEAITHWQTQLEACGLTAVVCTAPAIAAAQSQSSSAGEPWALLELDQPTPRLTIVSRFGGCWRSILVGAAPRGRVVSKDPKKFVKALEEQFAEAAQSVGLHIARVVVSGAPNEAFLSGLEKELGLPVSAAAMIDGSQGSEDAPALPLPAVGAALLAASGKGESPLNLLPTTDIHQAVGMSPMGSRRVWWLVGVLAIVAIVTGAVFGLRAAGIDIVSRLLPVAPLPTPAPGLDQSTFDRLRAKRDNQSDILLPDELTAETATSTAITTVPDTGASSTATTSPAAPSTASSTPATTTTTPKPVGGNGKVLPNDLGYVNIRTGPSTANEKVGTAAVGEIITITGEQNGWYAIKNAKGLTGWVSSIYVEKQ